MQSTRELYGDRTEPSRWGRGKLRRQYAWLIGLFFSTKESRQSLTEDRSLCE